MLKHVLYYVDSDGGGWFEISILGVFDLKKDAENKIKEITRKSVEFDKTNQEIVDRNKIKLKTFLDKNVKAIKTGTKLDVAKKELITTYNFLIENAEVWRYEDQLSEYLCIELLSSKLPELEEKLFWWDYKSSNEVYYDSKSFFIEESNYYPEHKYTGNPHE